jgi:DNA-directed RNA polymerase specialized sigma subunit
VKTRENLDETRRLFARYRATGDQCLRERLVLQHRPLARSLAANYSCGREPFAERVGVSQMAVSRLLSRCLPRLKDTVVAA